MGPLKLAALANWFAAVGEPTRIKILRELTKGSRNVTEMARVLNVEIVNVSHHLRLLAGERLATDEKVGRFVIYTLAKGAEVLKDGVLRLTHESGAVVEIPPLDPPPAPPAA